jgi:hypothetical protein
MLKDSSTHQPTAPQARRFLIVSLSHRLTVLQNRRHTRSRSRLVTLLFYKNITFRHRYRSPTLSHRIFTRRSNSPYINTTFFPIFSSQWCLQHRRTCAAKFLSRQASTYSSSIVYVVFQLLDKYGTVQYSARFR